MKIIIASKDRRWSRKLSCNLHNKFKDVYLATDQEQLDKLTKSINPDWIFFFHWSEIVDKSFYSKHKCVVIHTGVLPKDRGGSPIQNQILEGRKITNVNALVMQDPVDSGHVYCSEQITLQGSLNDIWDSIAEAATKVIWRCVRTKPIPWPQEGETNTYKRRKDNTLVFKDLESIYDQIRILDGEGYPNANLSINGFKIDFSRAKLVDNRIIADVKIYKE